MSETESNIPAEFVRVYRAVYAVGGEVVCFANKGARDEYNKSINDPRILSEDAFCIRASDGKFYPVHHLEPITFVHDATDIIRLNALKKLMPAELKALGLVGEATQESPKEPNNNASARAILRSLGLQDKATAGEAFAAAKEQANG